MSPELQNQVQDLQRLGSQYQATQQQRQQYEVMKYEAEAALEALKGVEDSVAVFRAIGSIMIQEDKAAAVARLTDESETMEVRIERTKKQEEIMRNQVTTLQKKIQAALPQ